MLNREHPPGRLVGSWRVSYLFLLEKNDPTMYIQVPNAPFFLQFARPARLRGGAGAPLAQCDACLGPPPSSVARALGTQSRARWFFFKGSRSAMPSHAEPSKPHSFGYFRSDAAAAAVSHRPSSSQALYFVTATIQHQALPFVTATDGASACVRVRVCHDSCRPRKKEQTHNLMSGPTSRMLRGRTT